MPWKTSRSVDQKAEFVSRLKAGERMTDLCAEYGIHRQTGYEVLARYEDAGLEGLLPRSRAPKHRPHRIQDELLAQAAQLELLDVAHAPAAAILKGRKPKQLDAATRTLVERFS